MNYAAQNETIPKSPVGRVRISRLAKQAKDTRVLTLEEAQRCCRMTGEHGLVFRLLLSCGLRLGELCALRWHDVQSGTLRVDESVTVSRKLKAPKGGKTRFVPLPQAIERELIDIQASREFYVGPGDYIFADLDGKPHLRYGAAKAWLYPARTESGVPDLDFQSCRRTCATLLEDRGHATATNIQDMLGHSDIAITRKHYLKPVDESQQNAARKLFDELLADKREDQ